MSQDKNHYYIQEHPFHKRGYQIFEVAHGRESRPVGEYIVMDKHEPEEVTHLKIEALQLSLNGQGQSLDCEKPEQQRVSFQRVGAKDDDHVPEQVIFYSNERGDLGETRRSVNAVLTFSKGEMRK